MNLSAPGRVALSGVASIVLSSCASAVRTEPSSIAQPASAMARQTSIARVDALPAFVRAHPFMKTHKKPFNRAVWVTDAKANEVFKCLASGCTAVGSGWSEPQGIAVDRTGNIYVADTLNTRVVELDKNGNNVAVLSDPGYYPTGVDVSKNGTVGVTNMISIYNTNGNVVFYSPGATSPTGTASGCLGRYYFGAFDAKGRFFNNGYADNGSVLVCVVPPGGTTNFNTGISPLYYPGGVAVIPGKSAFGSGVKQALVVADQQLLAVYNFNLSYYYQQISIMSLYPSSGPVSIAFPKGDKAIWTADAGNGSANEISYPSGGLINEISGFQQPIGVAVTPSGN